jgi:hypothetical protein
MKLRRIKRLTFWTLRSGIGESGGVIFDEDTKVTKLCRVVRIHEGLKWQIVKNKYQSFNELNEVDQECLDNIV